MQPLVENAILHGVAQIPARRAGARARHLAGRPAPRGGGRRPRRLAAPRHRHQHGRPRAAPEPHLRRGGRAGRGRSPAAAGAPRLGCRSPRRPEPCASWWWTTRRPRAAACCACWPSFPTWRWWARPATWTRLCARWRRTTELLLLDIGMPGMDGLTWVARYAGLPPVVFTTAHDNRALEAFEVHAVRLRVKARSAPSAWRWPWAARGCAWPSRRPRLCWRR